MVRRALIVGITGWLALAGVLLQAGPSRPDASDADAPMTDIHDIKPPERPLPGLDWRYVALAGIAAVTLLAVLFWMRQQSKRQKAAAAVPGLSPTQQALKELEDLRDVGRFDGREFYFRLSAILREYIRGRFGIDAPEMTVEELLPRIRELDLPTDLQGKLRAFFRSAEPIKFAAAATVERRMEADHAFAVAFVRETGS